MSASPPPAMSPKLPQELDRFPYCLHPELRLLLYHRCALYHASRACRNWVDYLQPDVTLRPKIHTRLVFFEGHGAKSASLLLVCRLLYLEAGPVFGHYLCLKIRSIYPYRALDLPGMDQADILSFPPRCTVSSLRHLHLEWYVTSREWARRVKPFPAIIQLLSQCSELRTIHFSLTITSAVLFRSPYLGPTGRLRKVESEILLVIQSLPPAAELRTLVFEGIFHKDWLDTVAQERPNLKVLRGILFEPPVPHPYSPEDDTPVSGQSESDLHLETTGMIDSNEDSDEGDRDELEQCE